jgi:hypothetical protein
MVNLGSAVCQDSVNKCHECLQPMRTQASGKTDNTDPTWYALNCLYTWFGKEVTGLSSLP